MNDEIYVGATLHKMRVGSTPLAFWLGVMAKSKHKKHKLVKHSVAKR
jgi:hypothetical protein